MGRVKDAAPCQIVGCKGSSANAITLGLPAAKFMRAVICPKCERELRLATGSALRELLPAAVDQDRIPA